jgi:hypothetical protein
MPVSLENLFKIGQLKEHPSDAREIAQLIAAAERGLADAREGTISPETRFDAPYRSITQIGLAALIAQGYRPDTNRPGHHMTIIQTLMPTLGIDARRMAVLDTLRRKRNLRIGGGRSRARVAGGVRVFGPARPHVGDNRQDQRRPMGCICRDTSSKLMSVRCTG